MSAPSPRLALLQELGVLPRPALIGEWRCEDPSQILPLTEHCVHWFGLGTHWGDLATKPSHTRVTWLEPEEDFSALPDGALDVLYTFAPSSQWAHDAFLKASHRVLQPGGRFLALTPSGGRINPQSPESFDAVIPSLRSAGFENVALLRRADGSVILQALKSSELFVTPATPAPRPEHRVPGYALLSGEGLEIGALDAPAEVPPTCRVVYFDAIDTATARELFPEANAATLVEVDHVGDLDRGGLSTFRDGQFSFVICNHVLEHVANPFRAVQELFRIVRPGGHVAVAIPDMRYTFDHDRPLTSFAHLWSDYETGVTENSDEHYIEFIRHVVPHVLAQSPERQALHLQRCRQRREHAHVWTSATFRAHLDEALPKMGVQARLAFSSTGEQNRLECFLVWEKR